MSKKLNPAAVGIFVAGAVMILALGLVILGAGGLFDTKGSFVVYFRSSANGLEEGSDVLLGGVKVGTVKKMMVQIDPETSDKLIPVVVELSADRLMSITAGRTYDKETIFEEENVTRAIQEDGLFARLMTKSALTGQLYVELDFSRDLEDAYVYPGDPIDGLQQIPSSKNQIEKVLESIATSMESISKVDFGALLRDVDDLVSNADNKVSELDLEGISDRTKQTLDRADTTLENINTLVTDESIRKTLANLEVTSAELKALVGDIDGEEVNVVITEAAEAVKSVKLAASNLATLTTPDSATGVRLNRTLASVEEAARSIEQLADFLKRNPSALISGKKAR